VDECVYSIKSDPVANEKALTQVRADKSARRLTDMMGRGWRNPGLVPVALEVFNRVMPKRRIRLKKQLRIIMRRRDDLLQVPRGTITEAGVRTDVLWG